MKSTFAHSLSLTSLTRIRSLSLNSLTHSPSPTHTQKGDSLTHEDSRRLTKTHDDSLPLTKTHEDSRRLTKTHEDSRRLTKTHEDSPTHSRPLAKDSLTKKHTPTKAHKDSRRLTKTCHSLPSRSSLLTCRSHSHSSPHTDHGECFSLTRVSERSGLHPWIDERARVHCCIDRLLVPVRQVLRRQSTGEVNTKNFVWELNSQVWSSTHPIKTRFFFCLSSGD